MTYTCDICGSSVKDGEDVVIGLLTTFHAIPSDVLGAFEKPTPDSLIYVNHAFCEGHGPRGRI
jgi:hypothetical protein